MAGAALPPANFQNKNQHLPAPGPGKPAPGPAAGTTQNNPNNPTAPKYCAFFSSTSGCIHGNSCQHVHKIPSKNSDDWNRVNNLLTRFKQQPSEDFKNAN